jgi:hypothetical protein
MLRLIFNRMLFSITILLALAGCTANQPGGQETPKTPALETRQVVSGAQQLPVKASAIPTDTVLAPKPAITQTESGSGPITSTPAPSSTPVESKTEQPRPTLAPGEWKQLPVIPEISDTALQIYQHGLELGNNPGAFSKIGDCGSTPAWFLGDFDRGPEFYRLGSYQDLEPVIQEFQGSYGRTSLAARSGFNASSVFAPLWSDRKFCDSNEAPLACEYRNQRPSIAFIMLGTNDVWHPDEFEPQMRKIIEFSIANGVIPVLSTKADNSEGDDSINATIARLAVEYDIPLWNYWAVAQDLPDQGLQEDQAHLTWARNFFDDPDAMQKAWPQRNLTALQILQAIWLKTSSQQP